MITLTYSIDADRLEDEKEYLRLQKISPAIEHDYDWIKEKRIVRIGMIVSADDALMIKLRHNLDAQYKYKPR